MSEWNLRPRPLFAPGSAVQFRATSCRLRTQVLQALIILFYYSFFFVFSLVEHLVGDSLRIG